MEQTKSLALATTLAVVYGSLGLALQNVAFGPIQVRVADALYPLIGVLGWPALAGTFLGHLVFNLYGVGSGIALGVFDLASPVLFLLPKLLIWRYGQRSFGLLTVTVLVHVAVVALWVGWLLFTVFGLPFWLSVLTVGVGETVAEVVIGLPLASAVQRRLR